MASFDKKIFDLKRYSSNTACICEDGESFSYDDLYDLSELFCQYVKRRCIILFLCEKEFACLVGYISCLNHNVVPLMIDSKTEKSLLNNYIELYHPDFIFCPKGGNFDSYIHQNDILSYSLFKSEICFSYSKIYDEIALLLPTSGSTGSQKVVKQSYKNILSNTESILNFLHTNENDRTITTLPLNYAYGLSIVNTHIFSGASILFTNKTIIQSEFWKLFQKYQITSFNGVPFIYEMLRKLNFAKKDFSSLRIMTQAGGHLDNSLQEYFAQYCQLKGIKFFVMYGQTEATARISYLPHELVLKKIGSIGIAIPGGRIFLRRDDGSEIEEPRTEGELMYKGDNVTLGYASCIDDLLGESTRNNVLSTGDIAYKDEEGFFYISGRKNRFLKIYGKRVALSEVETLLNAQFELSQFLCSGKDDLLEVYVKGVTGSESVVDFIEKNIGINRRAIRVSYLKDIPVNASGKIMYSKLNEYICNSTSE